jgi:hypothetical protein
MDLYPVWKKGGGPTAYGGETNDYFTTVEKMENGSTKYTSTRMLNTGDPYDYVIEKEKEIPMAVSIIYEGEERVGSFKMTLGKAVQSVIDPSEPVAMIKSAEILEVNKNICSEFPCSTKKDLCLCSQELLDKSFI